MTRAFALVLTCAVALGACGGDDLTAGQYQARANVACSGYLRAVKGYEQPKDVEAVPAFAEKARTRLKGLVDELDNLDPPGDMRAQHEELVALGERSVGALGDLAEAAQAGQQAGIETALDRSAKLDDQTDEVARALGLDACVTA